MRRIGKVLIIAGVMLLAGVLLSGISFGAASKRSKKNVETDNEEWVMLTYQTDASAIRQIMADVTWENIQIEPADGTDLEVIYYDNPVNPDFAVTEEQGVLRLEKIGSIYGTTYNMFHVPDLEEMITSGETYAQDIILRVPDCYIGSYLVDTTSGDIAITDVAAEQSIHMDSTSGNIKIEQIEGQEDIHADTISGTVSLIDSGAVGGIFADSTSGDMKLTNVETESSIYISSVSGNIYLYDVLSVGDMELSTTSGDVDAEELAVGGTMKFDAISGSLTGDDISVDILQTNTTSGDILLRQATVGLGINGSSTSGRFSISLMDAMEDYAIQTSTISGYVNLPNRADSGVQRYIDISTTSGNIEFEFEQ